MNETFIRQRLTQLRIQKNVSEYKMSIDLGHSKGYIQSISSGRALPSMSEFLSICDYFEIEPVDFFNKENNDPLLLAKLSNIAKELSEEEIALIINIAERLHKK